MRGKYVIFQLDEQNILSSFNSVNASNDWKVSGLGVGLCGGAVGSDTGPPYGLGTVAPPIGFAIFQGYYTRNNLWITHQLDIYGPGTNTCQQLASTPKWFVFAPNNDSAEFNGYCDQQSCFRRMSLETGSNGSWTSSLFFSPETFHVFSRGVYTLVGEMNGAISCFYTS
jgi:hypothetical protein